MSAYGVLVAAALLLCTTMAGGTPRLTETQAIQAARDFCTSVGVSVTATPTAQFPVVESIPYGTGSSTTAYYYQERWRVTFPGQARVEVADAAGVVSSFEWLGPDSGAPPGAAISRDDAVQRATAVLQASGQAEYLVFWSADETQSADTAGGHLWQLRWVRRYQGFPHRWDNASIQLAAETGALVGLSLNYLTSDPTSTSVDVTEEQADAIVQGVMTAAGLQNAVLDRRELEIVQPNTFWLPGGNEFPTSTASRLAYTEYLVLDANTWEVWIDAHDGTVLGGGRSYEKDMRSATAPLPLIASLLRSASAVRVYRVATDGRWPTRATTTLTSRPAHPMMTALRRSSKAPNAGPVALSEYKLVVRSKGVDHELRYIARTGRLGASSQWAAVPASFRRWLVAKCPSVRAAPRRDVHVGVGTIRGKEARP